MPNSKITLFDIAIDSLTMNETIQRIDEAIKTKKQIVHNSINANKVVLMSKDPKLKSSLEQANIINADGQSIIWASRFLKTPLPERVPGIDLMSNLMALANEKNYKVFLFGAKEEVVKKVADHYGTLYQNDIIANYRNGYFSESEELEIVHQINNSGANILFVAIPSPQKENFINKYKSQMTNINLLMGVGGSFDVFAGKVKRAPNWMQNIGFEWFYRLIQEPRKMWKRYLIGNIEFLFLLLKNKFKIGS